MAKQLKFSEEARAKIKVGVDLLTDAVKATLGPRGRNVIIEKSFGSPLVTKDGVTVAKEIELPDRFENMGAQMVKEVASKTSDVAGDGTTTATVLAQVIYREGSKLVAAGYNPMDLKRGIDKAVEAIAAEAGDSPLDARLATLYLFGMLNWIYMWYPAAGKVSDEELADQLVTLFLDGFLPRAERRQGGLKGGKRHV